MSLDNTTNIIQDEQDRRTDMSFCTQCLKVLAVVLFIVFVIVITVAVVKSKTTTGNTSGYIHAIHEPRTVDSCNYNTDYLKELEKDPFGKDCEHAGTVDSCIYNTPRDYLKELENDPFGKDCKHGSPYVKKTCYSSYTSLHLCDKCEGTMRLPSVCFCDKKIHCQKHDGVKPKDDGKTSCLNCLEDFKMSQYRNRGTCQCDKRNYPCELTCKCKEGFGQFMCSAILTRVCKLNGTESFLPRCNQTNVEHCSVKTADNEQYICNIFKDSNVELRKLLRKMVEKNKVVPEIQCGNKTALIGSLWVDIECFIKLPGISCDDKIIWENGDTGEQFREKHNRNVGGTTEKSKEYIVSCQSHQNNTVRTVFRIMHVRGKDFKTDFFVTYVNKHGTSKREPVILTQDNSSAYSLQCGIYLLYSLVVAALLL